MNQMVEAEYRVVQERTLPVIASEILQIEENVGRVALDGAIRIGERLKEAKEKVEHGQWEKWCAENLNYSKSKAEKLMKIANEYGNELSSYSKTYTCTDLSISKALKLLQVPEEEVENFAKENKIDELTVKELEEKIKALNEEKEKEKKKSEDAEEIIENYIEKNNELSRELDDLRKKAEKLNQEADLEELKELQEQLSIKEAEAQKLIKALEEEKQKRDKQVEAEVEKQREAIEEKVRSEKELAVEEAEKEASELKTEIEKLKNKLKNNQNENILIFKMKADQLQEAFAECKACINNEQNQETKTKLQNALDTVIGTFK